MLIEPVLKLNRLMVSQAGEEVYDQSFNSGLNIIRGQNGSGKTAVMNFIFYVFGGDLSDWLPEALACDSVIAELTINNTILTARREISTKGIRPMEIYWGPFEKAMQSAVEGWEKYPFKRSKEKESFSQVLFRIMNMPEVRGESASNITMHQIMRLIFIDQKSPPDVLFRSERFDTSLTRETVANLLLGIHEDHLYDQEIELLETKKKLSESKSRLDNFRSVLTEAGVPSNASKMQKSIDTKVDQVEKLEDKIKSTSKRKVRADDSGLADLQKKSSEKRIKLLEKLRERESLEFEITDTDQFVEELNIRLKSLSDATVLRNSFQNLAMEFCPACLSEIKHSLNTACPLCKEPLSKEESIAYVSRLRNQLELQVNESKQLNEVRKTKLKTVASQIETIENEVIGIQREINLKSKNPTDSRSEKLDDHYFLLGKLEAQLDTLRSQFKIVSLTEDLIKKVANLTAKKVSLVESIDSIRVEMIKTRSKVESSLKSNLISLMDIDDRDLPRSSEVKEVEINFRDNSFSINGKNQYSSSSMALLKNFVHLSIFLSSCELEFMRYPRLFISDNIEDKGMEDYRSHNLQKYLVEISKGLSCDHQIIISTSKICPELDNGNFCIGDYYTTEKPSLAIKKSKK